MVRHRWMAAILACGVIASGPAASAAEGSPELAGPSGGVSAKGPHHIYLVGDLLVTEPWIDAREGTPDEAYAYFTIENRGAAADRLVAARSDQADSIVVDANGLEPGLGQGGLVLPPHKVVTLERDGIHFIFKGLHGDVQTQPTVAGVLTFERAGPLHLTFATHAADAAPTASAAPPAETDPAR